MDLTGLGSCTVVGFFICSDVSRSCGTEEIACAYKVVWAENCV